MNIKPSVVFIKGVHSITGPDKTSDIGFPQLELEKLFEGATLKQIDSNTGYDSGKKYIYKDAADNVAVQDEGHFNCIKNGYDSIAGGINHYYILNGSGYSYNTVPDVGTWAGNWSFSNIIENKTLYSISPEADRICINSGYYEKKNNNYVRQNILTYNTYNKGLQVSWDENNKYTAVTYTTEDPTTGDETSITSWKTNTGTISVSWYYLSVDNKSDNTYIVQLLSLTFNKGVLSDNTVTGALYKLSDNFSFQDNNAYYVKNDNNFEELRINQNQCTFAKSPTTDSNFYIYQKGADWSYPNIKGPEYPILVRIGSIYNSSSFPLYINVIVSEISKTPHTSYTIYEKTAVKINYNYSSNANSLKFIFTDKTIPEVLEACGLDSSLEKYIHLTNLKYNKN